MLAPGTVLQNRYRIVRQLGQGGMATVYLAEDQRLGGQVAVKETRCVRAELRQAFKQEARLLSRLRHQALPHVTDYFVEGARQYLVMQFIDGADLEELLTERTRNERGPFTTDEVQAWGDRLLDVLEYLHGQPTPIIHRDIKPQNLKLSSRGEIVLLDFGLAKGATAEMSQLNASLRGYTRHYAPLEQIEGTGTSARSDLYALAATLYRLVTGELPPAATTRAAAVLNGQPDPLRPAHELNPQVPAAMAAVLARALAQNPDERPATAREMRQAWRQSSQAQTWSGDITTSVSVVLPHTAAPVPISTAPEAVTTQPDGAKTSASTYSGQTASLTDAQLRAVLRARAEGRPRAGRRAVAGWTVRLAASLLLFVSAAVAARDGLQRRNTPLARVAVMKYGLAVRTADGRVRLMPGDKPLAAGQWFKLHFTPPESGHLYLVAPNAREAPTAFLTAQPYPDWGVQTNLLVANTEYSFPPKPDKWLRITGAAETETYLVVFAPRPLSAPGFWTEPAGRELTDADQRALAALRQQHAAGLSTEPHGEMSVVMVPDARPLGTPLVFEIKVRRQLNRNEVPADGSSQ